VAEEDGGEGTYAPKSPTSVSHQSWPAGMTPVRLACGGA
jgi:hypothetical protein